MIKSFYGKLALDNLKRNGKTQFPYLLTCIGAVLMFYNVNALTNNSVMHGSTQAMMQVGSVVTAIFSAVFLFYTNSFLIKRRKKEFGLFFLLGMEKKHIAKMMLWETLLTAVSAVAVGLALGIAFSKLVTLLLYKLLSFDPNFGFEISGLSVAYTVALFGGIFLINLVHNMIQVYTSQPAALLKGGSVGEKEPKTNWLIALIGLVTLGTGYGISLYIQDPVAVIGMFFLAVLLVMIGTYCLFTAGSIAVLKLLKKNKDYYYKTKHFVSLSGMLYRMKQNAAGLASICLMSTAVLVMISTTVSMYIGMEDLMKNRYPQDMAVEANYTLDTVPDLKEFSAKINKIITDESATVINYKEFRYQNSVTRRSGNSYVPNESNYISNEQDNTVMIVIPAQDYASLIGSQVTLAPDEVKVFSQRKMGQIQLFGRDYHVQEQLEKAPPMGNTVAWMTDIVYVILPDEEAFNHAYAAQKEVYGDRTNPLHFQVAFDLDMTEPEKDDFVLNRFLPVVESQMFKDITLMIDSKQANKASFYELYGGLLFLGIFLGALFLMATVLIIYYKQVVEGYEDKERFEILQKVGMSRAEVKKSIQSQVLSVFALPVLAAGVHIFFAFPILTKLLAMLNLTNVALFAICTLVVLLAFSVVYALVYAMTAKVYYRIVHRA